MPADGNTHIWIIGDSGTVGSVLPPEAPRVRDGFMAYNAANGNEDLDLFLMLGDNAYLDGSDKQYQAAVFEVYPEILNKTSLWPTIGNHEMGGVGITTFSDVNDYAAPTDPDETSTSMPYIDIFTLPTQAEVGGVASGTEQYYSFNFGNIHIVSLDSQVAIRDATTMSEVDATGQSLNGQDAQAYQQISAGSGVDDKVVYTVAGSSGYLSHMQDVPHPAHFASLEKLGSVVLDASATTLEARFIDETGTVQDWFTISR